MLALTMLAHTCSLAGHMTSTAIIVIHYHLAKPLLYLLWYIVIGQSDYSILFTYTPCYGYTVLVTSFKMCYSFVFILSHRWAYGSYHRCAFIVKWVRDFYRSDRGLKWSYEQTRDQGEEYEELIQKVRCGKLRLQRIVLFRVFPFLHLQLFGYSLSYEWLSRK